MLLDLHEQVRKCELGAMWRGYSARFGPALDKRRSVGTRVQFSVFEMRLTDASLGSVVRQALVVIDASDSLIVYTIERTGER